MRVQSRDQEVLKKLAACRWLSTSQVKALCFAEVSMEMARRRLRLLAQHSFVRTWRSTRFAEGLHALAQEGRRLLQRSGWPREIRLESRAPRHFEHSLAINDLRVWMAQQTRQANIEMEFFYACWELPGLSWTAPVIPDALCALKVGECSKALAFEVDLGEESIAYIARTKLGAYTKGLPGCPLSKVVFITESERRTENLRAHTARHFEIEKFFFITRERLLRSLSLSELLL